MKKAIVTTTINPPTKALKEFLHIAKRDGWVLFIVGDQKTPHADYYELMKESSEFVTYLDPFAQEAMSKELSDLIGWNCIQRRNFGILAAYQWGAEVIATVDDDNIPYENWGKDLLVGQTVDIEVFDNHGRIFNPLARFDFGYRNVNMCNDPESSYIKSLWHRGVPEQQIGTNENVREPIRTESRKILVQADMWDGDPDISAVARMVLQPDVKFGHTKPFTGKKVGPFNSQNTFLHRQVIPQYFLFPHIGRMDDIWASYVVQRKFPGCVAYGLATVYQERNPHDLSKDLEAELIGYRHTPEFVDWLFNGPKNSPLPDWFPVKAAQAFKVWKELLKNAKTSNS